MVSAVLSVQDLPGDSLGTPVTSKSPLPLLSLARLSAGSRAVTAGCTTVRLRRTRPAERSTKECVTLSLLDLTTR